MICLYTKISDIEGKIYGVHYEPEIIQNLSDYDFIEINDSQDILVKNMETFINLQTHEIYYKEIESLTEIEILAQQITSLQIDNTVLWQQLTDLQIDTTLLKGGNI